MEIKNENFRKFIAKEVQKIFSETDLIAPSKSSWNNVKDEFKSTISELINNLENDEYMDADGNIDKAIKMLRTWKIKIEKDLQDNTN